MFSGSQDNGAEAPAGDPAANVPPTLQDDVPLPTE